MPSTIILIGYRGSGKTSVGRRLASELWKTFADVDQESCRRFGGKTIAQVWAEHGEPAWRKTETEVTRELCNKPDHVVALGGGTLMQPASREAVERAPGAVRVYLKCSPEELHRRISADKESAATRPNLTALGGGLEEIQAILAQREPVYLAVAEKTLDVTNLGVEDAARYLIEKCL